MDDHYSLFYLKFRRTCLSHNSVGFNHLGRCCDLSFWDQLKELSWISLTMLFILTILLFLADYIANLHFVDKAGGSKWGMRVATIGLIVGSFVIPPFGVIIVPFVFVLIVEMMQKKSFQESLKVAFATFMAFLSGTFAKVIIQIIMIVVFVIDVVI